MPPWGKASRKLAEEVSENVVRLAIRRAGARLAGKILVGSNAWRKAFEHIAEHFEARFVYQKGVHGVFVSALRSREALEPLVKLAVTKPSRKAVGRASVNGVFSGRVCTIIEREFTEAIGEELRLEKGVLTSVEAKILRIIVDVRGKPITAFPVASFF
jgi:hypothetical protein